MIVVTAEADTTKAGNSVPKIPKRNKLVGHKFEIQIIEMFLKGENSHAVLQKVKDWGLVVDYGTLEMYKRYFVDKRKSEIEIKKKIDITREYGPLLPGKETTVEYLAGLVDLREQRIQALTEEMNLAAEQEGEISTLGVRLRLEDMINGHLKEIQILKESMAKLTGGIDEVKRRQWIVGQVSSLAVKALLPLIPELQRNEALKIFRGDILKFSEEL